MSPDERHRARVTSDRLESGSARFVSRWPSVAVMGGSIGGLTAALALRELGCEVDVFERASSALEARGAGIGLHPMTVKYFTDHAPLDTARVVIELPWLRFLTRDGRTEYEERMNYRFSSWNTIYRALLANFGSERYHLGAEVEGFEQDGDRVRLTLAGGRQADAELLVCADGIASAARERLQPDARPRYAGYVAWRGTVAESELSPEAFGQLHDALVYCLLPRGHVLVYPIPSLGGDLEPGKRLANLVWYHNYAEGAELDDLMTGRDGTLRPTSVPPGMMRPEHEATARRYAREHMAPAIAEVLEKTEQLFVQAIYDIEIERMVFGRACLIGDAAFAVRPHAAAGTAKACADGWALHDALRASGGEVAPALARWEREQLALGRQLLERSRRMGERSQFEQSWVPGDPDLRLGLYGPGR